MVIACSIPSILPPGFISLSAKKCFVLADQQDLGHTEQVFKKK